MEDPSISAEIPSPPPRKGRTAALIMASGGVLILMIAAFWLFAGRNTSSNLPQIGQRLSDVQVTDLQGQPVYLSSYQGHPVLINFWASWCPPCRAEMPDIQAFYNQHKAEGLVLMSINSGEDAQTATNFVAQFGLEFPVLLDENYAVSDQWMINNLPTTILLDKTGVVRVIHVGLFTSAQMDRELLPHLAR